VEVTRRAAALALLVAASLATAPATAAPPTGEGPSPVEVDDARRHYARGVELYNQGADSAALAELERAYQLAPSWKILYDLALVELQLHDFAAALGHLERYLADGKDGVTPARRTEVEGRVAELRHAVAGVEVEVEAGARVTLDDVEVGVAPLPVALIVNPGRHRLGASKDGRYAEQRAFSVTGGDRLRLELTIPQAAALPPPPAPAPISDAQHAIAQPSPTPPEAPPPRREPSPLWIGWVSAGVLVAGGAVTGLMAVSANSDLTHAKNDGPTDGARLDSLSTRAHHFALASDLLMGAGLLTGGVTLYFTLRAPRAVAAPAVAVRATPTGAALKLTF
jgi:hypothetical protein